MPVLGDAGAGDVDLRRLAAQLARQELRGDLRRHPDRDVTDPQQPENLRGEALRGRWQLREVVAVDHHAERAGLRAQPGALVQVVPYPVAVHPNDLPPHDPPSEPQVCGMPDLPGEVGAVLLEVLLHPGGPPQKIPQDGGDVPRLGVGWQLGHDQRPVAKRLEHELRRRETAGEDPQEARHELLKIGEDFISLRPLCEPSHVREHGQDRHVHGAATP
jgi:hypothetical protein